MLSFTLDERDCTPPEDIPTEELREAYMSLMADIGRAQAALDLMQAELARRGEDDEFASDEADAEGDEDEDRDSGWDYPDEDDRSEFADPGGNSALRAATKDNPRNLPCPNCGQPNRLTPKDRALGYQCNECADRLERGCD